MGAGRGAWFYMALVPRRPLVTKDVMCSTEHHHVREVVTKAQEPETRRVSPGGTLSVQPGLAMGGQGVLSLRLRGSPPQVRETFHDMKKFGPPKGAKLTREGKGGSVFKNSWTFPSPEPQVGGSRDSSPITCLEVFLSAPPLPGLCSFLARGFPSSERGNGEGPKDPRLKSGRNGTRQQEL